LLPYSLGVASSKLQLSVVIDG